MKRILLSLMLVGGLMMAAPNAHAVLAASCGLLAGNSYAISLNGAEYQDGTANIPNPTPVAGTGVIQVSGGCAISGELIYDDNDSLTGPASCSPGGHGLSWVPQGGATTTQPFAFPETGSVPCFNGTTAQLSGTVATNSANQGTMSITDSVSGLTFNFSIVLGPKAGTPSATTSFGGNQVPGDVAETNGPPPTPAIIEIIGQKQGTASTTGIQNTTYGASPWKGESFAAGTGISTADSTTGPGSMSATTNALLTNADTTAAGTATFDANNGWLWVFSAALPGLNCHFDLGRDNTGSGPFADGTINISAVIHEPFTGACGYANVAGAFAVSAAIYGTSNTSNFNMFTGTSSALTTPGLYSVPNGASSGPSNPTTAGTISAPVGAIHVAAAGNFPLTYTNTSPEDCIVVAHLIPATGSNFASVCGLGQAPAATNDQPLLEVPVWCPADADSSQCTGLHTPATCCSGAGTGNCGDTFCTAPATPFACCTGLTTGTCPGSPPAALGGSCTTAPGQFTYLDASNAVGTVPAYDVNPGYQDSPAAMIYLTCGAAPSKTGNKIAITLAELPQARHDRVA